VAPKRFDRDHSLAVVIRDCFREFISIERQLDEMKRELALKKDFSLAGAFNLFSGYS
jgi:hypothetical protein